MGKLSFAVDDPAVAVNYGPNVVPFITARHRAVRLSPAVPPRLSQGVVVRLPKAPRADETITKRRAEPSVSGEMPWDEPTPDT
jgi:hypothetical protein